MESPATPAGRVDIQALPSIDPDPALLTSVCDPEPVQIDPDAGETTIFCRDAVVLGLRAATRATPGPITRIYVQRPTCAATPCSEDELSTATVFAWGSIGVVAVRLDSRLETIGGPERMTTGPWPQAATNPTPEVRREVIESAPADIADRVAYPYCGRSAYGDPPEVLACFRDSILLGRAAEAIDSTFGTEGGEVLDILRFSGSGAPTRYRRAEGRWLLQRGSLNLGSPAGSPSLETWD